MSSSHKSSLDLEYHIEIESAFKLQEPDPAIRQPSEFESDLAKWISEECGVHTVYELPPPKDPVPNAPVPNDPGWEAWVVKGARVSLGEKKGYCK